MSVSKICVFDFDGTLCDSPLPSDEMKALWEKAHDRKWPHKGGGWWSKPESLCIKSFDLKLIEHVKQDALISINDTESYTVLLTGRISIFQKIVKEILRKNGLPYFDAYYFNGGNRKGGGTEQYKLEVLEQLKEEFPSATKFEMWEDRVEHIPSFVEWGEKNYGKNFKMNII